MEGELDFGLPRECLPRDICRRKQDSVLRRKKKKKKKKKKILFNITLYIDNLKTFIFYQFTEIHLCKIKYYLLIILCRY